jgi:hypothetical protein
MDVYHLGSATTERYKWNSTIYIFFLKLAFHWHTTLISLQKTLNIIYILMIAKFILKDHQQSVKRTRSSTQQFLHGVFPSTFVVLDILMLYCFWGQFLAKLWRRRVLLFLWWLLLMYFFPLLLVPYHPQCSPCPHYNHGSNDSVICFLHSCLYYCIPVTTYPGTHTCTFT